MSAVGIVTIALGILVVCRRGALLGSPEAAWGGFTEGTGFGGRRGEQRILAARVMARVRFDF